VQKEYAPVLRRVRESCVGLLGSDLVGIYVHGSIAFGCFNWEKSDIDYIAVINEALSAEAKKELCREALEISKSAPPKGLEASFVLREHCAAFKYPTPYELHVSKEHSKIEGGVDKDLAAHFTVIKAVGFPLCGEPIDRVFGEVPAGHYLDSLIFDIENARENINRDQFYYILNLCRVLAYKQDGLILSKKQGARWALENTDRKYCGVIQTALNWYSSEQEAAIDDSLALEFCSLMLCRIYG